jgi:5-methylcytosine-specific restriction endonuclease McrA
MSRIIYDTVYRKYKNLEDIKQRFNIYLSNNKFYYDSNKTKYKLLLEIIDDKNDDEFNKFYLKYISNFQFKKDYIGTIYNNNNDSELIVIKSFNDVNDFITKICHSSINDKNNYYKELIIFLTKIVNIHRKLKEGEEEKKEKVVKEKKGPEEQNKKKKKKPISATMKKLVWNINIGEEIGKAKCLCCNSTDITQMSFNCGHIIAEANGGETIVSNLKPICQNCNSSMGTKNMEDFMKTLK